ncbi:MAG: hypothetical protein E7166_06885 [Firmicutes bacterium]|nr:hypothetical protein [Bacillota bacterium]
MHYNINNFYLSGNYIILNGWAVTEKHQNFTSSDTHEYSLKLTSRKTGKELIYYGTIKYADKTQLIKQWNNKVECTGTFNTGNCYYSYTHAGFEFNIPISDLEADSEYDIKLRIYEKIVNLKLQQSIFALGVDSSYERNGVRYQLYSDINKTNVTITSNQLYMRSGPGQNYALKQANFSCSQNGTELFWYPQGYYNNIKGVAHSNQGAIDSELWVNLRYDLGYCVNGKARAINGTTYDGWGPWIYMIGGGTPAIIKTTSLDTFTIDELKTYTAKKNTNTKALITLTSSTSQNLNIKAYHNDSLVYNQDKNISGTKTFEINYKIPNTGTLKFVVSNQYRSKDISSKIYIASEETYNLSKSSNDIITVNTPIMVLTDKNGNVTQYKEKINLSAIPYEMNISQGRGLSGITSAITYYYPLSEFTLNSDYNVYALYPSSEDTLNYEIVNGKVKVNLKKDGVTRKSNYDISYFHHPNILLSVIDGKLYNSNVGGLSYYNGGGIWYPSWDDELGTYNYEYIGTNLGVNKITIKKDLSYTITSKMFDTDSSKYIIKRVKSNNIGNMIYKKTFTIDELKEKLGIN